MARWEMYQVILQCFQEDLNTVLHEGYRDYKSELQEYTQEKFGCVPTYSSSVSAVRTMQKCSRSNSIRRQFQGLGAGKSKKEAEQDAARKVLAALRTTELLTNSSGDPLTCPENGLNVQPQ